LEAYLVVFDVQIVTNLKGGKKEYKNPCILKGKFRVKNVNKNKVEGKQKKKRKEKIIYTM
jgi:hypothetical protein